MQNRPEGIALVAPVRHRPVSPHGRAGVREHEGEAPGAAADEVGVAPRDPHLVADVLDRVRRLPTFGRDPVRVVREIGIEDLTTQPGDYELKYRSLAMQQRYGRREGRWLWCSNGEFARSDKFNTEIFLELQE